MTIPAYHEQQTGKRAGELVLCPATKRCTLPGKHYSLAEVHQRRNSELIENQINNAATAEAAVEFMHVKLARAGVGRRPSVSVYGAKTIADRHEADVAEAQALLASGDVDAMEAHIQARVNSEDLQTILRLRDENEALLADLTADRDVLRAHWEATPHAYYEDTRQVELAMIDVNEELTILRRQLNEYKDVHAPLVNAVAEAEEAEMRANGTWAEYDEPTLNGLVKAAEYESGTREWLEHRQGGIGGSDVGPIIGAKTAYSTRAEILASKLEPISDEQVEEQTADSTEFKGALGRGNAWEKRMFLYLQKKNPDDNLAFCKASWQHQDVPHMYANFDGLLRDKNNFPDGILEIKTASTTDHWGEDGSGIDGVPDTYRAQTLWYAHAAGFRRGKVAVVINDNEYREYAFDMTPELKAEAQANADKVEKFVNELNARKAGTFVEKKRARLGFSKGALDDKLTNPDKQKIFTEVSNLVGGAVTPKDVERQFLNNFHEGSEPTPQEVETALVNLYRDNVSEHGVPAYVGVDLETSGASPTAGHIIEFGGTLRENGKEAEDGKISQLYGLSPKSLAARSTGKQEVHGISETQIAKRRQFSNEKEGYRVMQLLRRGKFMLAHNAAFETRWMRTHVPGFADAMKRGQVRVVDSMFLVRRLLNDSTPNDTMESFATRFGIPYENSHRAYSDSVMMSDAFEALTQELRH